MSRSTEMIETLIDEYDREVGRKLEEEKSKPGQMMFGIKPPYYEKDKQWMEDMKERFLKDSPNKVILEDTYSTAFGYITAMDFAPDGSVIVVGFSTGIIQIRSGKTGEILKVMRSINFPPQPIYCLKFDSSNSQVCYAPCTDGKVYKLKIPKHMVTHQTPRVVPKKVIYATAEPRVLQTSFFTSYSISSLVEQFIEMPDEMPVLAMCVLPEDNKIMVGCSDSSLRVFDTNKSKIIRAFGKRFSLAEYLSSKSLVGVSRSVVNSKSSMSRSSKSLTSPKRSLGSRQGSHRYDHLYHSKPICSLKELSPLNGTFVSGAWDNTIRVWDIRSPRGVQMVYANVNPLSDCIDIHKNYVLCGNWLPTRGHSLFDLRVNKCVSTGKIQNRHRDIDGEYIYASRFWKSRHALGKYALLGGSGTKALEIVNLHNRYITASFPVHGSILAVASHRNFIAFGGTYPSFNLVTFYDPKRDPEAYIIPDPVVGEVATHDVQEMAKLLEEKTESDPDKFICECRDDICSCSGELVCECGDICSCEGMILDKETIAHRKAEGLEASLTNSDLKIDLQKLDEGESDSFELTSDTETVPAPKRYSRHLCPCDRTEKSELDGDIRQHALKLAKTEKDLYFCDIHIQNTLSKKMADTANVMAAIVKLKKLQGDEIDPYPWTCENPDCFLPCVPIKQICDGGTSFTTLGIMEMRQESSDEATNLTTIFERTNEISETVLASVTDTNSESGSKKQDSNFSSARSSNG